MAGIDSTDLAIIRILEILKKYTDEDHPMTQVEIGKKLENDYGIQLERKAIARKINLLDSADIYIQKTNKGCYYDNRTFDEAELRLLIDSVLCSRHINDIKTKDIIKKLCSEETIFFKKSLKHIHSISQWENTESHTLFTNIDLITKAIEDKQVINFQYFKYNKDKELVGTSWDYMSPYTMVLHNQRYYLMGYSDYWNKVRFLRIDRMNNMKLTELKYRDVKTVEGYESGLNYKELSVSRPYLFNDKLELVTLKVKKYAIDQVIDWFGKDIKIKEIKDDDKQVIIELKTSPNAMLYWALQYLDSVEIISPETLREKIGQTLMNGLNKYKDVATNELVKQKETIVAYDHNNANIFYNVNPIKLEDDIEDLTNTIINKK